MQSPLVWYAAQRVRAAVLEADAGSEDELLDRVGHEHLARTGQRPHPGGDVDGETAQVRSDHFHLAGVDAGPRVEPGLAGHRPQDGWGSVRIAADNIVLWAEQFAELHAHPEKTGYAAAAFASVVSAIVVDRGPTLDAIDRIAVPVLMVLGDQDLVIERQRSTTC